MGYKRAGFDVVGCVEIDPRVNASYVRNLKPRHNFLMDLRAFNAMPDGELPDELFRLDVLDGSPPCSSFSTAGQREKGWGVEKSFSEGQAKQRLDDLFFTFMDTVEKLRPKVVVAENVTGLIKGNARGYVNAIAERFKNAGYALQAFKLNAACMEVPQRRERVFFVANRMGFGKLMLDFDFPPVPFACVKTGEGVEVGGDVEGIGSMVRMLDKARPEDRDLGDVCKRERGVAANFGYKFVRDDEVAPTVTRGSVLIRMPEAKFVSTEDIRNVGTFPQDYRFGENDALDRRACLYAVAMSVPPSMTAHIADEIGKQWLEK